MANDQKARKPQMRARQRPRIRIGIDTGGTFTDFVVSLASTLQQFKLPSTPRDPSEAVLAGIERIRQTWPDAEFEIVHGSTVATNALLQGKGARTALITTAGFEDMLEIGRQARPRLYDLNVVRPAPLVPERMRFGLTERVAPGGEVVVPLCDEEIDRVVDAAKAARPESVAISLLFSFANPRHEKRIEKAATRLGVPISCSYRILPEYREYERTSTVVVNAYVMPLAGRYLNRLQKGLGKSGLTRQRRSGSLLRVMQSNGGSISADAAAREPVRIILSGPAAGVVGALRAGRSSGVDRIMTFDMGGTSTDVALCMGRIQTTNEAQVAGWPIAIPVIDIHTVGAGGGSIARLDPGGALRVGPESAGADPGPVCYGRGNQVTVTDANLILGRFGAQALLGGDMPLDADRAARHLDAFARSLSQVSGRPVTREQAAAGIIDVANANMERVLRRISIERGHDPRDFTLVCFGGAGGLHVCALAAALRINRIIIPVSPGTLSALGALEADVEKDYSQTVMMLADQAKAETIDRIFRRLESSGRKELSAEGFDPDRITIDRWLAVRYRGQSFELDVPWGRHWIRNFHRAHEYRYGYADQTRPVEFVSARIRCVGKVKKPRLGSSRKGATLTPRPRLYPVVINGSPEPVPVFPREHLPVGFTSNGPAIIAEYSATTFVPPGFTFMVEPRKNIIITPTACQSASS